MVHRSRMTPFCVRPRAEKKELWFLLAKSVSQLQAPSVSSTLKFYTLLLYWFHFSSKIKMDHWWLVHGTQDHWFCDLICLWAQSQNGYTPSVDAWKQLASVEIVTFLDWSTLLRKQQGWEVTCPSNLNNLYGIWKKKNIWTLSKVLQCTWQMPHMPFLLNYFCHTGSRTGVPVCKTS